MAQDIAVMFAMLGPCYEISRRVAPDRWRRYLELLLDGCAPPIARR